MVKTLNNEKWDITLWNVVKLIKQTIVDAAPNYSSCKENYTHIHADTHTHTHNDSRKSEKSENTP